MSARIIKQKKFWFCLLSMPLIGFLISLTSITTPKTYYAIIKLPDIAPPDWLFTPVWTILYLMIGAALYLLLNMKKGKVRRLLLTIFTCQLFFNFIWSWIFFGQHNIALALMDIILLWLTLLLLLILSARHYKAIFYLLIPYFLWVSFASWLNYQIYLLN